MKEEYKYRTTKQGKNFITHISGKEKSSAIKKKKEEKPYVSDRPYRYT